MYENKPSYINLSHIYYLYILWNTNSIFQLNNYKVAPFMYYLSSIDSIDDLLVVNEGASCSSSFSSFHYHIRKSAPHWLQNSLTHLRLLCRSEGIFLQDVHTLQRNGKQPLIKHLIYSIFFWCVLFSFFAYLFTCFQSKYIIKKTCSGWNGYSLSLRSSRFSNTHKYWFF